MLAFRQKCCLPARKLESAMTNARFAPLHGLPVAQLPFDADRSHVKSQAQLTPANSGRTLSHHGQSEE
jgi:hypothetical protein